jgi:MFS family permease
MELMPCRKRNNIFFISDPTERSVYGSVMMKQPSNHTILLKPRSARISVFNSPAFCVLWLSEAVSLIGDRILMIALINMVYDWSGSASAVSVLPLIKAVPALLLGTLAGVFVDRWSRKWVMVLSNLILFVLVLAIPLTKELLLVYGIYFVMAVVSQFFIPARSACIPELVPEKALLAANSLFAAAFVGAIAIGPALGGWIIDRYGMETAYRVDALTFLVPAIAVSLVSIPQKNTAQSRGSLGGDWREGMAVVRADPEMRYSLLLIGTVALLIAALSALGVILVRENLGGSAGDFGWVMSVTGAGMLCGAVLSPIVGKRFNRSMLAASGAALGGGAMLVMALSNQLGMVMAAGFGLGFGFVNVQVNAQTTLQKTPDRLRGRILGLSQTVMGSVTFAAAGLAGVLAGWLGTTVVLAGAGAAVLMTALVVLYLVKRFKAPEHSDKA